MVKNLTDQASRRTQRLPNIPREVRKKVLREIRGKLEEEMNKEIRGVMRLRKKIHDLKRKINEDPVGAYRQVSVETIDRNEKYYKEHDVMALGLESAIDTVEMEEEEQDQQRPPPQPSPDSWCPTSRRKTHNYQKSTEGGAREEDEDKEEDEDDELSEVQHGTPSTNKRKKETGDIGKRPPGRTGNGITSSRNKIEKENQEEVPMLEDPQAQGQPTPKKN